MSSRKDKILITGACGILGTALAGLPGRKIFFDRCEKSELLGDGAEFVQGDVCDYELMRKLLSECHTLIHLAGCSDSRKTDPETQSNIFNDNIRGAKTAFDAARDAKIEKIIYASSNHAVGMYEIENLPVIYKLQHDVKIDENVPVRPDSFYGVSKVFGETYGRFIAENGGPKVYVLRIGSVRDASEDHPYAYAEWGVRKDLWKRGSSEYIEQEERLKAIWLSRRDFLQLIEKALEYDGAMFDIFYGVSANERGWFNLEHTRKNLGFVPLDNSEAWFQIKSKPSNGHIIKPDDVSVAAIIPLKKDWLSENDDFFYKLLAVTIGAAKNSRLVNNVFVATDSEEVSEKAKAFGADVPFLRPKSLSEEDVRVDQVLKYFLERLEDVNRHYEVIVSLDITHPFRPADLIDNMLTMLLAESFTSVVPGMREKRPLIIPREKERAIRIDQYASLRKDREPYFLMLPSLACATLSEFIYKSTRFGSKTGIMEIDFPFCAVEIRNRSPETESLIEKISGKTDRPDK
ncbi:MAG: hypothetical protein A2017_07510 [Lentisphaerae bacterium GWF2_44_16]|nr:MAG: hypothetical protein A2017_07510 [Lentisphaerae bacterium GWF2_44_16]